MRSVTCCFRGRYHGLRIAFFQNFSVASGMSDKSISLSGRAASFLSSRLSFSVSRASANVLLTIFVIANSLLPSCAAGRNNTDDLMLALLFCRMGHEQHYHSTDESDRPPSRFSILDPLPLNQSTRIQKHQSCQFERNPMLPEILVSFRLIPFEQDHLRLL